MRNRRLLVVALALLGLNLQSLSAQSADAAAVDQAIDHFFEVISAEDASRMASLLAVDFEAIEKGERKDKSGFVAIVSGFFEGGGTFDFIISRRRTNVHGQVAETSLRAVDQDSGNEFFDLFLLRKTEGRWVITKMASTYGPNNQF
jgi:hypothetical protein